MNDKGQEYNNLGFPVTDCRRCSGRGHMSEYANVVGGRCFDCKGTGKQLTPAAAKAYAAYTNAVAAAPKKLATEFAVGDRMRVGNGFREITAVEDMGRFGITFRFANSRCDFVAQPHMMLAFDSGINLRDFTKKFAA